VKDRMLGKTGFSVAEIGLGTWQVGGKWGQPFDDALADRILDRAAEDGVSFLDTADVYSGGLSEAAVGRALRRHPGRFTVATKCGRQVSPHVSAGYTPERMRGFVEASLSRLGVDCLDLIQLHCPPTAVYDRPEIFGALDRLRDEGKIRNLGVSVETVDEGLRALEYPSVASVQVIFNLFRLKPAERLFAEAQRRNVGIIVRVPLASGLLTGKLTADTVFGPEDHRQFNRNGEAFDKGETFSGVPFDRGLEAVEALKAIFPSEQTLASWALRWILMFDAVSVVIPGASRVEQVDANTAAACLPPLTETQMAAVRAVYDRLIAPSVHHLW
jgi:aryl-alcohol dehydrogenase-like predicted oxidoreductase